MYDVVSAVNIIVSENVQSTKDLLNYGMLINLHIK
jgi:hypothetical protein